MAVKYGEEFYDNLYKQYREFMDESTKRCLQLISDEHYRNVFKSNSNPLSRQEFEKRVDNMGIETRTRFIRRIDSGYEIALMTEGLDFVERLRIVRERE